MRYARTPSTGMVESRPAPCCQCSARKSQSFALASKSAPPLGASRLTQGHVRYGCGRHDARTTRTAPHKCADWQRAAALALPQGKKFGVDDVIGAGITAGAESDGTANPRSGV